MTFELASPGRALKGGNASPPGVVVDPPSGIGYPQVVSAFSEIAHAISNEKADLDTLLHLVAERICSLLEIRRCSVYLRDQASGVFRGQVAHSDHDIDVAIKQLTAGIEADGFTREILRTQRPVLIVNAQSDPRPVRSAMIEWHVRTMLGVPMILRGEVIGLLFLDNEDLKHDFTPEEQELSQTFANLAAIAISQAQLTAKLRSTLSTAAQQNAMLRRAAALEDRLTNLVLEGANLREIAAAVTELTGKPCSIHDADYRRLASATPAGVASVPRLLDPSVANEPAVREALSGLTARRPTVVPPIPSAGLHQRCLVAAVQVGTDNWGYLVLTEHRTRLGAQDAIVAKRTATVIALELSGKRRAAEAESHAVEALARDLLHGSDDECALGRRADYHGLALSEPHVVVHFSQRNVAAPARLSPARLAEAFARHVPEQRAFAAGVENGAAVVLECPSGPEGPDVRAVKGTVELILREISPDGALAASISTICRGAADFPGAYDQTCQISRGIATFGAADQIHVLTADDLGAGRLLLATADRSEADRFVQDTLGALLDDSDHGIHDLFVTLQTFFDCARNVRRSATQLNVHENTIRYRLSRIENLTGLDIVSNGDMQLSVELALLILRLEDRLSAPKPAELVRFANVET
jgi:sugar diacid utilization regulator